MWLQNTSVENASFYNLGDPDGVYAPSISVYSPKDKPGSQTNYLPMWGIDSIMNANTPAEKVRAGQNWILNQGGKVYK